MQKKLILFLVYCLLVQSTFAQKINWLKEGSSFYQFEKGEIVLVTLPDLQKKAVVTKTMLQPDGQKEPLTVKNYTFSDDQNKVLIFTNSKRVWREETRGDYWVLDINTKKLTQIGKKRPESTLMFAKLSPDGSQVAYVSERNIYVENLATGKAKSLTTTNGTPKLINGTFDWVYEEEFFCRDGFRWSADGQNIAYWQIDANKIRDYFMINTTDSIYPTIIPVEYPKVGERPSPYKIGVVNIKSGKTNWMKIPGDPGNTYVPRMEWASTKDLIIQYLNRKQNESSILICDAKTGNTQTIHTEKSDTWIDLAGGSMTNYWTWLNGDFNFLWQSEKDGWNHLYQLNRKGENEVLITKGNYDVMEIERVDDKNGFIYFYASPDNATQKYLYRVKTGGSAPAERLSPNNQVGTHGYQISPDCKYAIHTFSNYFTPRQREWITLPDHKPLKPAESIDTKITDKPGPDNRVEFFQVTTVDGVTMDGWLSKPKNFDPSKKYPILFYVYSEPAGATVRDGFGVAQNGLYDGDMAEDGYIYCSLDGRGTPAPKGSAWRKAIYRKIGVVNIRDQAMGALEVFKKWSFVDTSRVAVWGWSGGGSATLNLLFQYPDIYKTGISVAAVANQLTYDNIYQERYMGLPQENRADFVAGSPITHAKNLRGNLLYIHGTGDDNVHYQNAEMLVNELIKHNRQFQFMPYPNRSHGVNEGEGTDQHLSTLYTQFLRKNCPPGGK